MTKRMWVVILAVAATATGCVTNGGSREGEPTAEEKSQRMVLAKLEETTALAVNAQRELAMTADAKVARESLQRQRLLTDVVSYDFYGDVEDILRDIAMKYAYDFSIYGNRPPERVNVNVFSTKRPMLDILKQIGNQSGPFVDVKLTKTAIELYYKEAPRR